MVSLGSFTKSQPKTGSKKQQTKEIQCEFPKEIPDKNCSITHYDIHD